MRGPRTVGEIPAAVAQARPQRAGHVAARRVQRLQAVQQRRRACAGRAPPFRGHHVEPPAPSAGVGMACVQCLLRAWAGRPAQLLQQAFSNNNICSMTERFERTLPCTLCCTCPSCVTWPAHHRWACRPAIWPARWAASSAAPRSGPARAPASRGAARQQVLSSSTDKNVEPGYRGALHTLTAEIASA